MKKILPHFPLAFQAHGPRGRFIHVVEPVHRVNLWIALVDEDKAIQDWVFACGGRSRERVESLFDGDSTCACCVRMGNDFQVIWLKGNHMNLEMTANLVHEAVHFADYLMEGHGHPADEMETRAYLTEFVCHCGFQCLWGPHTTPSRWRINAPLFDDYLPGCKLAAKYVKGPK